MGDGAHNFNPIRTAILIGQNMNPASREPVVLALDSAGSGCSVVIAAGETVLAAERCETVHGQAEMLLPMADVVTRSARLYASAADIVATAIGPGSFTGIRVALAAMRPTALPPCAHS